MIRRWKCAASQPVASPLSAGKPAPGPEDDPLLSEKNVDVRLQAACAIGDLGTSLPEVAPKLIALLEDKAGSVRGCAAYSLGKLGAMEAVEPIVRHLAERNAHGQEGIEGALATLGDKSPSVAIAMGQWITANPKKPHNVATRSLSIMGANAVGALPQLIAALNEKEDSTSVWAR
jgi:hypothetical protein